MGSRKSKVVWFRSSLLISDQLKTNTSPRLKKRETMKVKMTWGVITRH